LSCASNKAWFWQHNWIDFVTSIPIPSAQVVRYGRAFRVLRLFRVLRSFRVLRMLRLLRVVRAFRVFLKLFRGMEKLEQVLDVRMMKKSLRWLFGIMALGAAVIYSLEGHMATPVGSAAESAWWSFTTVVTGGFGDLHNPVTGWGRMLTVLLIVSGMIVVGVFTATLTSVYMAEENEALQIRQESLERTLANIQASNEQSRQDMAEMMSRLDGPGGE
jgi:voltage-gated potassium channel